MSIRDKILTYIDKHQLIHQGDRLLVACSGGSDSMMLLHFLYSEKERLNIEVSAVHVDHMLRGEESEEDCRFVERFCSERHIPFYAKSIPIPEILAKEKGNLEAVCRRERYNYFKEIMEKYEYNVLVLGHHADDQIESIFMGLVKGTMQNGAIGIVNKRQFGNGRLVRPLLIIEKTDVHWYLKNHQLSYREDSSNETDDFTRNRFRHHITPLLKKENPKVAQAILKWTETATEDERYFMELATLQFERIVQIEDNKYTIDSRQFKLIAPALQRRVVLLLLNYLYKNEQVFKSDFLIESILLQCTSEEGHGELYLPDNARLIRHYYKVVIMRQHFSKIHPFEEKDFPLDTMIEAENGLAFMWTKIENEPQELPNNFEKWYFRLRDEEFPLLVRTRQIGDRIHLPNMLTPKKLSRIFIDEKIPNSIRDSIPLIVTSSGEVLAALGIRLSKIFSSVCREQDQYILIVKKDISTESYRRK